MPRRPSRLSLHQTTATATPVPFLPTQSSTLSLPTSPASPRTPLAPPARLHLRTLIPSPPLSPTILTSAPTYPYPWIWRCHLCHSVYKLGVTRRCLEDGHFFCSLPTPPSSPDIDSSSSSSSSSDDDEELNGYESSKGKKRKQEKLEERAREREKRQRKRVHKQRRRRKRRMVRGCRAEFDYTGWSAYNIWRREVAIYRAERKSEAENSDSEEDGDEEGTPPGDVFPGVAARRKEGERLRAIQGDGIEGKEGDCWTECDFPSECHNFRLERLRVQREAERVARRPKLVLAQEWEAIRRQIDVEEEIGLMMGSEEVGGMDSSAEWTAGDGVVERERRGQLGEAEFEMGAVDGSVSSGSRERDNDAVDGEGGNRMGEFIVDELVDDEAEVAFVEKKRKKSIAKIHQLTGLMLGNDIELSMAESGSPPSSPLKRSFGVGEMGVEVRAEGSETLEREVRSGAMRDGSVRDRSEREGDEMVGVEWHGKSDRWRGSEGRDLQMEELLSGRSDFARGVTGEAEFGDEVP